VKAFVFGLALLFTSAPVFARCVVEIFSEEGEPMGYIYQENECRTAMSKCRSQLARLNSAGAVCEITLDIPGAQISVDLEY
jgi:hypothetical protein